MMLLLIFVAIVISLGVMGSLVLRAYEFLKKKRQTSCDSRADRDT